VHHNIVPLLGRPREILELRVSTNDTFLVRLAVQLGTGYRWELISGESKCVTTVGPPLLESPNIAKPGALETQVFNFRAESNGTETLLFSYVRPWERTSPLKHVEVRVLVD